MTDFRAELQSLIDACESFADPVTGHAIVWQTALDRARAALAEPQREWPTDEDLQNLWRSLMKAPNAVLAEPMIAFARAVLARWGHGDNR